MTADDYEYLAEVGEGETVERPGGLWRRRGEEMDYLSLIDWEWHPVTDDPYLVPHPDLFVSVGADQVRILLGDRQRFVKYWVLRETSETETRVYRQLPSPENVVEEVFGRDGEWIPTRVIEDFLVGGPHDHPDLQPIDPATAERLIEETRGVTGATNL